MWGLAGLISDQVGGVTRFYLYDARGNTDALLDAGGNVLGHATYTAWGSVLYSNMPANVPFGWQGAEGAYTDPESGLVYLHHRYYAPAIGRFLTRDPSGFSGGVNLYAYCFDDPINYGDPLGLDPPDEDDGGPAIPDSGAQVFGRAARDFFGSAEFQNASPQRKDFSSALHQVPGLGQFLGGLEALSGKDYIAGTKVSVGGRLLGLLGMLPMISALRPAEAVAQDSGGICAAINDAERNCFVAGTPVQMADGSTKPIEAVKTGDQVLSRDPQTGKTEAKAVVATYVHQAEGTLTLRFSDGDQVTCTPEHLFSVDGKGFVPAGQLGIGTSIVTRAGPVAQVTGITSDPATVSVYNFSVADDHTYFVGTHDGGEWVHNSCGNPIADAIANGHAYDKHVITEGQWAGMGLRTRALFAQFIDDIMKKATGINVRAGVNGKTYYWDDVTQTFVVHNPRNADLGTAFQPRDGIAYFLRQP